MAALQSTFPITAATSRSNETTSLTCLELIRKESYLSSAPAFYLPTLRITQVLFARTTAYANAKINVTTANTGLINLATSYGSTTEICSLTYDPTTETISTPTTNQIVTDDSSEINGFASHHGIVMSRDGATLIVYDNTKFSVYSFANWTWSFVRTKTTVSPPDIVVLSHDGTRMAYSYGSLNIENTITGASLGTISVSSLHTYAFKDNTTLALLQGTNDIQLYEYDGTSWSPGETLTYSGQMLRVVCFSPVTVDWRSATVVQIAK